MYKFAPVEAVVPIPMLEVATRVKRFVDPKTFRVPPTPEAAFRVVTLAVERFEAAVVLRVAAKRLEAFMIAAFPLV
jgi:hypothetical protein